MIQGQAQFLVSYEKIVCFKYLLDEKNKRNWVVSVLCW